MAHMLVNTGAHHVVMIGGPRDQFFDLAARNGDSPDDFDLHKTTFPTVRYYLALEQELKAAGVRYEYVEAGNVEDFQGYKNAVNAVLNSMPVDGVDAVVSSDIVPRFACAKRCGGIFRFRATCRSSPTTARI